MIQKDYSEQSEFLNSEPYYASKKIVIQSSDFPVRRTGSYRHKKALQECKCRRTLSITKNSSGDEIANVNFLYNDIVHVIQNTIDSCINSSTARRGGYVLERMFTKFSEITQCNGHYAVQGHSRSPILVPIERSYTTSY